MAITPSTDNLAIIAALDNLPNDTTGLTAAQLKAKFDEGPTALQTYINDVLIHVLDADNLPYQYGVAKTIKEAMEDLTAGVMPDASVTFAKLAAAIIASQAQAEAGTASDVLMTPQRASQAIAALTPAFDYKKLVSTTTESAATTISVNLPDLTGYRQLKIKVFAKPATTSADTLAFRFNDISTSSYYTATTAGTGLRLGSIDGFSNGTYVDADIILNLNALELNGFVQSVYGAETGGKSFVNNQVSVSSSALAPASLSSINIFTTTYNIAAGAVIDVWGIK